MSHLQWNSPKYVLERKIYSLSYSYIYIYENGLKTIALDRANSATFSSFKKFFNKKNQERAFIEIRGRSRCLETHTNPSTPPIFPLSYPYRAGIEWAEM